MNFEPRSPSHRLLIRVIGAPLLLALLAFFLYKDALVGKPRSIAVLVFLLGLVGYVEFVRICRKRGYDLAWIMGGGVLVFMLLCWGREFLQPWLSFPHRMLSLEGGLCFLVCCCVLKMTLSSRRFSPESAAMTVLGTAYLSLLGCGLAFAATRNGEFQKSIRLLLFLIVVNKVSDMAAFVVGKAWGTRKLAPLTSPGKTWEGTLAGFLAGSLAGYFVLEGMTGDPKRDFWTHPAWLLSTCILVAISAQVGDLVESSFKRWANVKDSGNFLPEFGGVLDLVDGFLLSAPTALLMRWLYEGGNAA